MGLVRHRLPPSHPKNDAWFAILVLQPAGLHAGLVAPDASGF